MKLEISIFKVYFKCGHGLFLLAIYHNSLQVFSSNSYINIEMQYIEIIYYHFVDRVRSIESILTIFGFHSTLYSIYSHLDYIKCKNWLRKGTKPHYKHSHGILHAKKILLPFYHHRHNLLVSSEISYHLLSQLRIAHSLKWCSDIFFLDVKHAYKQFIMN